MDTIYPLYKYCETIYLSWMHGKLTKQLDGRQMLNLFSATVHFQNAESARLYLQLMDKLTADFPWLYNLF